VTRGHAGVALGLCFLSSIRWNRKIQNFTPNARVCRYEEVHTHSLTENVTVDKILDVTSQGDQLIIAV